MTVKYMQIKELREELGWRPEDLSAAMGVAPSILEQWEREVILPSSRDLPRLAALLRCEIGALYTEEAKAVAFA